MGKDPDDRVVMQSVLEKYESKCHGISKLFAHSDILNCQDSKQENKSRVSQLNSPLQIESCVVLIKFEFEFRDTARLVEFLGNFSLLNFQCKEETPSAFIPKVPCK